MRNSCAIQTYSQIRLVDGMAKEKIAVAPQYNGSHEVAPRFPTVQSFSTVSKSCTA